MPLDTVGTKATHYKYTTVTGFFLQDEPSTEASTFEFSTDDFGLLKRIYETDIQYDPNRIETQWQRFEHYISSLRNQNGPHVQYKLLYLARHGEGVHNVAETLYGTTTWDVSLSPPIPPPPLPSLTRTQYQAYWSKLPGNDTLTWADAHLTPKGEQQALTAHRHWTHMIATQHTPSPESYYVSPLTRCLTTAQLTFSTLPLPPTAPPFRPVVKELLRETIGMHTCDRRSSRTYIQRHFPSFSIEPGLTEEDELWSADVRESDEVTDARVRVLLDDIFANDGNTFLSLTSHSGAIAAILRVVGHRVFRLQTGGVIPVLVRAEWVEDS